MAEKPTSIKTPTTARQMMKQLLKVQDIICMDDTTWQNYLVLGLTAAFAGKEIKATLIRMVDGKEVERIPKDGR